MRCSICTWLANQGAVVVAEGLAGIGRVTELTAQPLTVDTRVVILAALNPV